MRLLGWYILDGHTPVRTRNYLKWSWWMHGPGSEARRRVALDTVGETTISTVFLGIDLGIDRPELFETMIFGGFCNEAQWRYATWEEAEVGHAVAVELARRTQNIPPNGDAEAEVDL